MKTYLDMQKQKKFMVSIVALRKNIKRRPSGRRKWPRWISESLHNGVNGVGSALWIHVYNIFLFKNISSKDSFEPLDAGGQLLELGVWIRALGTLHGGQDRQKGHCPALR